MIRAWSPSSWLDYTYNQVPDYPNHHQLEETINTLTQAQPLVQVADVIKLKSHIARAGRGEAFILQGGDCAELFEDCHPDIVLNKVDFLSEMSGLLHHRLQQPIIRIGRIAGQYAKPRSSEFEIHHNTQLPSYRGDLIHSRQFRIEARQPNPKRLLEGYHCAQQTLKWIARHHPLCSEPMFFTSHEALHLHYEQALTRKSDDGLWFALSTHFPWIGVRTAIKNSAHLELLRGVSNPIGLKVGPQTSGDWLAEMVELLNPTAEEGRIVLMTRLGAQHVQQRLPSLIQAVQTTHIPVTWSCDPMHGNTKLTSSGLKTRHVDDILFEINQTERIHQTVHSHLGGLHLEFTNENVTECLGGPMPLSEKDLHRAYHSPIDPRLNKEQFVYIINQLCLIFKRPNLYSNRVAECLV